eukprot:8815725-Heterocapsa_arctica.AAC.1
MGDGRHSMHVMSIYGISGARGHIGRTKSNGMIIEAALRRGDALGNVPVIIAMDANQDPETVAAMTGRMGMGWWVDAGAEWARRQGREPDATYDRSGKWASLAPGSCRTRID